MRRYTITALNAELEVLLRSRYPTIEVAGEVAQVQVPGSGHAYMTLRDSEAGRGRGGVLGAVCWRDTWRGLRFRPEPGDRVICRGRLGVYGQRGAVQLYVSTIQRAGDGELARQIAQRIARLQADGLLDPARKRTLPEFPRIVGVATSRTGAALQDFLKVSRERFPAARVLVVPCVVQGERAPASILRAVELLIEDGRPEVIVVTRGGGSKEDLLAFQDEHLARYLAACPVPVISAVGHQIDTTIADLVADVVVPTPTAAAVRALPDGAALTQRVDEARMGLDRATRRLLISLRTRMEGTRARLRHPGERLVDGRRRLGELEARLGAAAMRRIRDARIEVERSSERLTSSAEVRLRAGRHRVERAAGQLSALSPLGVLARGYAIVSGSDGVILEPQQVRVGQVLDVRVRGGRFGVEVAESRGHSLGQPLEGGAPE